MAKETETEINSRTYTSLLRSGVNIEPPAGGEPVGLVKMKGRRGHRKDGGIIIVSYEERALVHYARGSFG